MERLPREGRKRLKIAISNSMRTWGGGENWSLTAAEGLAARGHDVLLICQKGGELEKRAGACRGGFRIAPLRIRGDINPVAIASAIRLFREHGTQTACCNLDREVRSLGVAARLVGGIPFVRRRGSDYGFKNSLRYRLTYRYLVDRVIVNSESTRKSVLARNRWLPPESVVRIYNGIDTSFFVRDACRRDAIRKRLGYSDADLVVGMVGSLLPRKRHSTLLSAAAELAPRFPGLRILIVGTSPKPSHLDGLKSLAGRLGIGGRVEFAGGTADVLSCYIALDVLAMPSENEGFGYAAAEAMSCGIPVVVSDASSLPEVVGEDGRAGFIFPLDDALALAAKLEILLADPGLRACMGSAAADRVRAEFCIDTMIDRVEEFFTQLAGGRSP
jgi:glycosyltransferase involved in cell wall biosynthesis